MTREEALEALKMMAESGEALPFGDARGSPKELREIITALSSCACGGRPVLLKDKGRLYEVEELEPGWCDLALDGWVKVEPQEVEVLIFALPTEGGEHERD